MQVFSVAVVAFSLVPSIAFAQDLALASPELVAYRADMFTSTPASVRPPLQEEASAPRIRRDVRRDLTRTSPVGGDCRSSQTVGAIELCLIEGWVAGERAPRTTLGNDGVNDVIGYFVHDGLSEKGSILVVRNTDEYRGLRSGYSRKMSRSMRNIPGYRKIGIVPVSIADYEVPLHVFEGETGGAKNRHYHVAFVQNRLAYGVLATVPATVAVDGHADMLRFFKTLRIKDGR